MAAIEHLRLADWPRLRNVRIGVRLRTAFFGVVLLMLIGSTVTLWHFREIQKRIQSVSLVEQRMAAILRLHNNLLRLINQLHRASDAQSEQYFEKEANRLLAVFSADSERAKGALQHFSSDTARQAVILDSLSGMIDGLPARIAALNELARAGDWRVLHARLLNQVDHTDDVVAALVQDIDRDLSDARRLLREDVAQAQHGAVRTLAASGLLSLLVAVLLGVAVTRSITQPLASLDSGTRRLAKGDFGHDVTISGNDELAHLAAAFNRTARELEQMYGQVRDSERRFRSLIEKASDLILVISGKGELLYVSPSISRALGYSPEMLAGQPIRDLVSPEEVAFADYVLSGKHMTHGEIRAFDLRFRHQDGSWRNLEGTASNLLADAAVAGIVVNARDVTDRKRAEQELREREDQLRQAQKMEAIGRLAGGVAHDFNNLLTVINGYCEFLLSDMAAEHPLRSCTMEIQKAGQRAAQLTRQLLAFSRKQMVQPSVLDLNDVIRDSENMLRRVIGEDVELIYNLDGCPGGVEVDANQIHQVMMNLAANARDAMPSGGKLIIQTSLIDVTAGSDPCLGPGGYVLLTVTDTGQGMDEPTRQRIFEPFFTRKEQGKGTGLGLSTVYGIVAQNGGHIAVESEVGRGTSFRIYLHRVERKAVKEKALAELPLPRGTETILLVEDQPEVRQFASTCLKSFGYHVIEAENGEEALQLLEAGERPIDLLFTDVVMPGMTGVELSKRLQLLNPALKVIYASGYTDNVILQRGIFDMGSSFLPKPYNPAILAARIRQVLDPPSATS